MIRSESQDHPNDHAVVSPNQKLFGVGDAGINPLPCPHPCISRELLLRRSPARLASAARAQLRGNLVREAASAAALLCNPVAGDGAAAGDDALVAASAILDAADPQLALLELGVGLFLVDHVALAAAAIVPDTLVGCYRIVVVVSCFALELVNGRLVGRRDVLLVLDVTGSASASAQATRAESRRCDRRAGCRTRCGRTGCGGLWAESRTVAGTSTAGGERDGLGDGGMRLGVAVLVGGALGSGCHARQRWEYVLLDSM